MKPWLSQLLCFGLLVFCCNVLLVASAYSSTAGAVTPLNNDIRFNGVHAMRINNPAIVNYSILPSAVAATAPTITTTTPSNITNTSATVGGSITSTGGANVTEYGVVYSTSAATTTPTTANSKVVVGTSATGAVTFATLLTGLSAGTTYYLRAYAINSVGTSYGAIVTFSTTSTPTTPSDINSATNTVPENSSAGTLVGLTAYSSDPAFQYNTTNLALNKTVYVSSLEGVPPGSPPGQFPAAQAVDGSYTSRWSSIPQSDPQWLTVDLGGFYDVSRVKITWESAYAKAYLVQVSNDNTNWTTIKNVANNTTTTNDITGLSASTSIGRYVRIYGTSRASSTYGYSIFELEVYGSIIRYSLTNDAGGRFTIDPVTGVVSVANGALLDYENNTSHSITVQATNGTYSSTANFTIAVTNVNEAPVITSNGGGATASTSIPENSTVVTTVAATDVDAGTTLTYSITGGADQAKFNINPSTGALTFKTAPIYSSPSSAAGTNAYVVNVTVSDGALTDAQIITVNVTSATYSGYAYRIPLTLQTSTLGISGNLTNFPVLLKIQNAALIVTSGACNNKVQFPNGPTGYDFAFVDPNTSAELNYQVDSYNQATGTLLVWVKLATLNYASNNTLTFYFGNATQPASHNLAFHQATWSSVVSSSSPQSYKGVWHFSEVPSASAATLTDATGAGNNLQVSDASYVTQLPATVTDTLIARGVQLSSTGTIIKSGASNLPVLNTALTMSAWVYYTTYPTNTANVMVLQNGSSYAQLGFRGTNNPVSVNMGGGSAIVTSTSTPAVSSWHYLVYTFTPTTNSLYVDGALTTTSTTAPQTGTPTNIVFGSYTPGGGEYYTGYLDEARVINTNLSADWIKAEYQNQKNPASFTVAGTMAIDAAYVISIPGGVNYTVNGTSYTPDVPGVSISNANNGNGNFIITGATTVPSGSFDIYGLTVNSGTTLALNGNTINVGCNIVNNGTVTNGTSNTSAIIFDGSLPAQTYTGSTTSKAQVDKLLIKNTAATAATITIKSGGFDVYNLLTLTSGNLAVSSTATLTLKSTATQTAAVDQIANTAYKISGNVNVERFLTGGDVKYRSYRLLSAPVYNSSTNNIDLTYVNTTTGTNYGALTGGPGGASSGFTINNGNPTMYLFKESIVQTGTLTFTSGKTVGITAVNSTGVNTLSQRSTGTATVPVGNGWMFYFIGNNQSTSTSASRVPENTTMTAKGVLNQGNVTVNLWYAPTGGSSGNLSYTASLGTNRAGFNMVGNPYASTIDLNAVASDNPGINNIYVLSDVNPNQSYSVFSPTGSSSPASSLRYAVSGQGFLVHATGTGQKLTFKETEKAPTTQLTGSNLLMGIPKTDASITGIYVKLEKDSTQYDYCGIYFRNDWVNTFDPQDALDLDGPAQSVNISSYSTDGTRTAINRMAAYNKPVAIRLYTDATSSGLYKIKVEGIRNIDTLYNIWLRDKYKKDSLDIRRYGSYNFNVMRSDTASYGANRFELVFRLRSLAEYRLLSFSGARVAEGIKLTWKTQNEGTYTGFILQKQDGSKTYLPIYQLQSNGAGTYTYIDQNPQPGNNWYRLSQNDVNENITYSDAVNVPYLIDGADAQTISLYPNPVKTLLTVVVNTGQQSISYESAIYSSNGTKMLQQQASGNNWSQDVSSLKPGLYFIEIRTKSGTYVGKNKFIKY